MAKITLTYRQIMNLGLWGAVSEYKGWDYLNNNGVVYTDDQLITFDDKFEEPVDELPVDNKRVFIGNVVLKEGYYTFGDVRIVDSIKTLTEELITLNNMKVKVTIETIE